MRIAQVAPLYESVPPRLYGGTERVVSWLTEEFVRQGHEVTLFASGDSLTNARLVPLCQQALRLDSKCVDPLAHHIHLIERVMQWKEDFDVIHFHTDYLHFSLCRRADLCHVTTLHGCLNVPDLVPLYREFSDMPVTSISDAQRLPLPWINWQGTVHHGMPENLFRAHLRPGHYLAFLGRVSPEKGVDRAIEIAKRSGIPLKIAAKIDRADRDYFDAHIKPLLNNRLVEFVGEINDLEKNDFLGNAAALLFPINWSEPFGIVLIEALACGLPVIAFPHGSVPEIIEDGVSGFLVNSVREAAKAADQISRIDRQKCRHAFEARFNVERMAKDYLAIYQRAMKQERKSIVIEPKSIALEPKSISLEPKSIALTDGDLHWMKLEPPSSTT